MITVLGARFKGPEWRDLAMVRFLFVAASLLIAGIVGLPGATTHSLADDASAQSSGWDCVASVGSKVGAGCYDSDRNYFCTLVFQGDKLCLQHVQFDDIYCFLDTRDLTCLA